MSGFIYGLTNCCMPHLVKIGMTKNHPIHRATELYTTGVPIPFVLEFAIWVQNPLEVEQVVHEHFAEYRVSTQREFFRIDTETIVAFITEQFVLPGYAVATPELVLSEELLDWLVQCAEIPSIFSVAELIAFLPESAIAYAGERYKARKHSRIAQVSND